MIQVRADDLPVLRRNPDVQINEHKSGRFYGIFMSADRVPWNNQKVRAAIAYSIDRQTLAVPVKNRPPKGRDVDHEPELTRRPFHQGGVVE